MSCLLDYEVEDGEPFSKGLILLLFSSDIRLED